MSGPATQADVRLEADIHALENNPNGFEPGAWIPYLQIDYTLTKRQRQPHRGPLHAHGRQRWSALRRQRQARRRPLPPHLHAAPSHMPRHVDKETGVGQWYAPFTVEYEFVYAGVGKKGGY